jgi:hypothetical protein
MRSPTDNGHTIDMSALLPRRDKSESPKTPVAADRSRLRTASEDYWEKEYHKLVKQMEQQSASFDAKLGEQDKAHSQDAH